jgi:hypothetical protein
MPPGEAAGQIRLLDSVKCSMQDICMRFEMDFSALTSQQLLLTTTAAAPRQQRAGPSLPPRRKVQPRPTAAAVAGPSVAPLPAASSSSGVGASSGLQQGAQQAATAAARAVAKQDGGCKEDPSSQRASLFPDAAAVPARGRRNSGSRRQQVSAVLVASASTMYARGD